MPSSRGSSWPRDWTHVSYVSCIGRFFTICVPWEAQEPIPEIPCLRGLLWPVAAFLRLSLFSKADSPEASWSGILKDVSTASRLGTKPWSQLIGYSEGCLHPLPLGDKTLSGIFLRLHWSYGLWGGGRERWSDSLLTLYETYRLSTSHHRRCQLWSPGRGSTCQAFSPPFPCAALWRKVIKCSHSKGRESNSNALNGQISKLFTILP